MRKIQKINYSQEMDEDDCKLLLDRKEYLQKA